MLVFIKKKTVMYMSAGSLQMYQYVGNVGQLTRPTQPFILLGSINE